MLLKWQSWKKFLYFLSPLAIAKYDMSSRGIFRKKEEIIYEEYNHVL